MSFQNGRFSEVAAADPALVDSTSRRRSSPTGGRTTTSRASRTAGTSTATSRRASALTPIIGLADTTIRVGASVGIGHATGGEDPGEVVRRADAASYRAKREGKGRIHHVAEGS